MPSTIPTTATPPTRTPPRPRSGSREPALAAAWLGALWLWVAWSCAGDWSATGAEFGWIVPPLALYFAWQRRSSFSSSSSPFLFLFLLAAAVGPLELVRLTPLAWRVTLWAMFAVAAGLTLLVLPGARRPLAFPLAFAALALPWPTPVEIFFTGRLAEFLAAASAETMHWFGVPALAAGRTVTLPQCTVGIEGACSGLHSIQSALILALGFGELRRLAPAARAWLVLAGLALALAENFLRLLVLCGLGSAGGAALVERGHDPVGWLGTGLLLAAIALVARSFASQPPRESGPASFGPISRSWRGAAALSLAGFAAAHAWMNLVPADQGPSVPQLRLSDRTRPVDAPPGVLAQLQPTTGGYFAAAPSGPTLYHFFWAPARGNARQFFHRPDVCMPGNGWTLLAPPVARWLETGGRPLRWWDFPFTRDGRRVHLLWTAQLAGQTVALPAAGQSLPQRAVLGEAIRRRLTRPSFEVAGLLLPEGASDAQAAVNACFGP